MPDLRAVEAAWAGGPGAGGFTGLIVVSHG